MYVDVGNLGTIGIILLIRYWHQYSISAWSHGPLLKFVHICRNMVTETWWTYTDQLARDFFYTFHFVWSCWRMLVRNEVTKGYADSEPDVYRRHGSSMYIGLLWRQSLMCMVSGCRPRQYRLIVFPKTMYQTVRNDNIIIPKKKFCGLGLQVEFCYPGGWHVGVGISCNLIMW